MLGRCYHCLAPLAETVTRPAPETLVASQAPIQADYRALLSGDLHLTLPDRGGSAWEGVRRRLHFLRESRRLSRQAASRATGIYRRSGLWRPSGARGVSLGSLLRAIRFSAGSLRDFAQVAPPSDWDVPAAHGVRRPCVNPWCRHYGRRDTTWRYGKAYYCEACGVCISLRESAVYGLSLAEFWFCGAWRAAGSRDDMERTGPSA